MCGGGGSSGYRRSMHGCRTPCAIGLAPPRHVRPGASSKPEPVQGHHLCMHHLRERRSALPGGRHFRVAPHKKNYTVGATTAVEVARLVRAGKPSTYAVANSPTVMPYFGISICSRMSRRCAVDASRMTPRTSLVSRMDMLLTRRCSSMA